MVLLTGASSGEANQDQASLVNRTDEYMFFKCYSPITSKLVNPQFLLIFLIAIQQSHQTPHT